MKTFDDYMSIRIDVITAELKESKRVLSRLSNTSKRVLSRLSNTL